MHYQKINCNRIAYSPADESSSGNKMWGGRFAKGPSELMDQINVSIDYDKRLYAQDIACSIAHAAMLAENGIISQADYEKIAQGLNEIKQEIEAQEFEYRRDLEDIHMNIEARLTEKIGDAGARLHTARSRNDQVATDFRLYAKESLINLEKGITRLINTIVHKAEEHCKTLMPGFTHLQVAQPVVFGHHLLAWVEALARDKGRVIDAIKRVNECPLGAAALAGTAFPIDRFATANKLGFANPMHNSLDAVSSRDFVLEILSVCSILSIQLSRMSEEIVVWTSAPFSFVQLSDAFSSGSSIMPQKRNPDAAEIVRARAGRVSGHLMAQLMMMKGLSLAYAKDMQEDKEAVFDCLDVILLSVDVMDGMIKDMTINHQKMAELSDSGHSTATDLADWMVRELGLPFRNAHHATAKIVELAETKNCKLYELKLADMQLIEPKITNDVMQYLHPAKSTASRTSYGGTSPKNVKQQVERWKNLLQQINDEH